MSEDTATQVTTNPATATQSTGASASKPKPKGLGRGLGALLGETRREAPVPAASEQGSAERMEARFRRWGVWAWGGCRADKERRSAGSPPARARMPGFRPAR